MSDPKQNSIKHALNALPVFPLPHVVLFPGQTLPLHVFEPRYLALVEEALAGNRLLGVPQLHDGDALLELPKPPFLRVFGVGEIIGHRRVFGDQLAILVRGLARVRQVEELDTDKPFRLVGCELLPSVGDESSLGEELAVVNSLLTQLAAARPQVAILLEQIEANAPDLETLIDLLAAYVVGGASQRQALLEAVDLGHRVALMAQMLADIILKMSDDEKLH